MRDAIDNIFKSLTAEEKATLSTGRDFWRLHGVERLGLPSIMVTDGPHGLRKQSGSSDHVGLNKSVPATCFPTAAGLAATWNIELLERVGQALGRECLAEQVSVLLGPGANLKRHPLGGRNFEYFSEDPLLSGMMASAWVRGVQSLNVGASLKHYALNNHESGRMVVDVVTDERTLREMYLPGFEYCVKDESPWTIMCAYNKFRGVYLSENEYLLKTILRDDWGYDGVVVTDWSANHNRVDGVRNGQSLEMPGSGDGNAKKILASLQDGSLTMEQLDDSVRPVVELISKSADALDAGATVDLDANHNLARTVAEEACVLLKNDNDLLPLKSGMKILVVGGLATNTRYQGSGSSQILPTKLEQPLDEIKALAEDDTLISFATGFKTSGEEDPGLCEEALAMATNADAIVVIAGLTPDYESEGFDRSHMQLPANQLTLIETLRAFHDRTVIILQNGSPVELPFNDSIGAILEVYLGGQAGASALARIIYGLANPSGKLAETFAHACADIPSNQWYPGDYRQSQYREGIWIGYRYFDTADKPIAYPFGHGLSYTRFEYSELTIDQPDQPFKDSDTLTVTFSVRNSGNYAGAETAQVYVGQSNASVPRPRKELKGFCKVFLEPGESKQLSVPLDFRSFAFWCVKEENWVVESDDYLISVGASVADIRLSQSILVNTGRSIAQRDPGLACYFEPAQLGFDDISFEHLLGHAIPPSLAVKPFQLNSTLKEIRANWLGRWMYRMVFQQVSNMIGGDSPSETELSFVQAIVAEMPLRSIMIMSQGKLKEPIIYRLIHAMNNRWLKVIFGGDVRSE